MMRETLILSKGAALQKEHHLSAHIDSRMYARIC